LVLDAVISARLNIDREKSTEVLKNFISDEKRSSKWSPVILKYAEEQLNKI
jgi:hypothetical protein